MCQLAEEWKNEQTTLHKHFLLFGQSVDEHIHLVLVVRFVHLEDQVLECLHIFGDRLYHFGYFLVVTHYDKLKLAQMVVGRGFECRTDNSFQNLVAYLSIGKITVCPVFSNTS